MEFAGAQIGQGLVGLLQRVARRFRDEPDPWRQTQEIDSILTREVGHRHELALLPQQAIGKAWNVRHVNPRADDSAALAHGLERQRNQTTYGRKDDAASSGSGGDSSEPPVQTAPRRRAKSCVAVSPGRVKVNPDRPCHLATCAKICAAAP